MQLFTSESWERKHVLLERNVIHCLTYSTLCTSNRILKAVVSSRRAYDEQCFVPNQAVYLNTLFGSRKGRELIID